MVSHSRLLRRDITVSSLPPLSSQSSFQLEILEWDILGCHKEFLHLLNEFLSCWFNLILYYSLILSPVWCWKFHFLHFGFDLTKVTQCFLFVIFWEETHSKLDFLIFNFYKIFEYFLQTVNGFTYINIINAKSGKESRFLLFF